MLPDWHLTKNLFGADLPLLAGGGAEGAHDRSNPPAWATCACENMYAYAVRPLRAGARRLKRMLSIHGPGEAMRQVERVRGVRCTMDTSRQSALH